MSRIKNYMNNRAVAPIAVDTTATVLLAADTNRDCFTIVNDGPETVYLGIGVVPTAGNGVPVYPGCNFEMSFGNFTGDEIQGITAAGASVVFALNNIKGLQNSATGGGGGGAVTPATSLSIEGLSLYRSNIDFAAAFNNATTLDLTNMTFIPATADILGVMVLTNTGSARELTPHTYAFEYTSTGAATGTLVVAGAGFVGTDTFVVIMRGPVRGFNVEADKWQVSEALTEALIAAAGDTGLYRSGVDFGAAFASAETLDLTGLPISPVVEDFIAVRVTTPGNPRTLIPSEYDFAWAPGGIGEGVLTVTGADFDAGETFVVLLRGRVRGYEFSTDSYNVTDVPVSTSAEKILNSLATGYSGTQIYYSGHDFDAVEVSATELGLTSLPFAPEVKDFIGVIAVTTAGVRTFYDPFTHAFTWTPGAVGEGTLAVDGAAFDATDEFTVFIRGAIRAYDPTTETYDYTRNNPDWANPSTTVMLSETAGTDSVNVEYLDISYIDALTLYYDLNNGSGLVEMDLAYTIQDDGTPPESCAYVSCGLNWFGQATWDGLDAVGHLEKNDKVCGKYLRVTVTASGIGASDDGQWYVAVRKDQ